MAKQLDILALEPFFGGARRAMLETVVRCSRHRWTVLKLPPRKIERRLTAAAIWFSEQISRHWAGRVDVLFTSEAMNLASLYQLSPQLSKHPSVVYFHEHQLPDLTARRHVDKPLDLVNLNTAQAADEIWFNSAYHRQTFMARATALVDRHPELSSHNPMDRIRGKARLMHPPVDLTAVRDMEDSSVIPREAGKAFVETRGADMPLLNDALAILRRRGVPISLVTVGPVDDLDPQIPRQTIPEQDDAGQVRGMCESMVILSAKTQAASDYQVIRALTAGCRPVLPDAGVYPELLPEPLRSSCLYDTEPEPLADMLEIALTAGKPAWQFDGFRAAFKPFDAIAACKLFDERLEQLMSKRA